jgi:hypothetical protein
MGLRKILLLATLSSTWATSLPAQNPVTAVYPSAVAADGDLYCWKNGSVNTLSGAINDSALSIDLTSAANFCAPGVVTIGAERIKICSIASNTLTVCSGGRGFDSSTAASHSSGATVAQYVPARWLNQVAAEIKAIQAALGPSIENVAASDDARFHDAVTLAGTPNYLTISGQQITRASIDLATNHVTGRLPLTNFAQGSALSILGVTGNATANYAGIAAGTDHQVLRRSGTSLVFGALNLAQSAAVTGILPGANGGTGNGFFAVAGPAGTLKTFTLPDASATILTTNAAVTVAQGGTGIASGTSGGVPYFSGSTTIASSGALTANAPVIGGGAGNAPTVGSRSGNTTEFATVTGAKTSGDCVEWDAHGNLVAAGDPCGTGGGGGFSNPMTQAEDLIKGGTGGAAERLAVGSEGQVLKVVSGSVAWGTDSTGGSPAFSDVASGTNTTAAMVVGTGASLAVSGSGTIAATTSAALAANPADCSAGQYANAIAANGDLTCAQVAYSQVSGTPTLGDSAALNVGTTTGTVAAGDDARFPTNPVTAPSTIATDAPVLGNANDRTVKAGTRSGNTTEFATVSGTKTTGKQLAFDASGNVIASASDIGGGGAGTANFEKTFTSETSVSITSAEHGWSHAKLVVECYDNATPRARILPDGVTVNTSTYAVTVTFAVATTGACVVNGGVGPQGDPGDPAVNTKSATIFDPVTGDTNKVQWAFEQAVTLTRVWCSTDTGTLTIQLDERAEATPNTAGTNMLTAALVCDNNTEVTTSFTNATAAQYAPINLQVTAASGSPGVVRIHVAYTID